MVQTSEFQNIHFSSVIEEVINCGGSKDHTILAHGERSIGWGTSPFDVGLAWELLCLLHISFNLISDWI